MKRCHPTDRAPGLSTRIRKHADLLQAAEAQLGGLLFGQGCLAGAAELQAQVLRQRWLEDGQAEGELLGRQAAHRDQALQQSLPGQQLPGTCNYLSLLNI